MVQNIPLVQYLNGERKVVGEISLEESGLIVVGMLDKDQYDLDIPIKEFVIGHDLVPHSAKKGG